MLKSGRRLLANVGFVGLGQMGSRMAPHLWRTAGHTVTVFDMSPAAVAAATATGAKASTSVAQACTNADFVFLMLPDGPAVRAVTAAALGSMRKGGLLCDCSTVDPATSTATAAAAAAAGMQFLDAPVSGGVGGAEAATLTFMVGGAAAALQAARGLLEAMGKKIVHCGAAGAGISAKLCNNAVLAANMVAYSEAMLLGKRLGIEPATLAAIFAGSTARSWVAETYSPWPGVHATSPASRGFTGGFACALMAKDLRLALDAAAAAGQPMPTATAAAAKYADAMASGLGGSDFGAVIKVLDKAAKGESALPK